MSVMNLSSRIGLSFDGQCEAAFKSYERCWNGKIEFVLRWGESPVAKDAPAEWAGKILHARLVIGQALHRQSGGEKERAFSVRCLRE